MARTAKSFIGKLPLAGAFALLFAPQLAEAKGNPATEKLNREKRIELAASESTIKMLAPNHVTTENGKRVIKLNSQNSDRARTIYVDNHTSWAQRSADSVYESGSSQYHLFKTALEKVCPDRAMQKKIIQIMAGDYQEKYGNPSDPNSYTPKIGTTEAGAATVYQLTSDTAKHLSDIDKIASSLPKERYISLMNLCSDTISKGAEGAILLDLNSTRNNSDPNSTERAGTVYDSSENTAEANAGTVYDSSNENTASETNAGTVYDSPAENTPQK